MSGWREQLKKLYDGTESTISTQLSEKGDCVDCVDIVPKKQKLKTHKGYTPLRLVNEEIGGDDLAQTVEKDVALTIVEAPPLRKCSTCVHDKLSPVNPSGGLTSCAVRDDVTPMIRGTREVGCALYVSVEM